MTHIIATIRTFEDINAPHESFYYARQKITSCPSIRPPNNLAYYSGHSTRCFFSADIEWPAMSERSESNGDEGNRTLIPAMRPRCAPVTPRPQTATLKLPLITADNTLHRLPRGLPSAFSGITKSHQLNYSNIFRDFQNLSYLFGIK